MLQNRKCKKKKEKKNSCLLFMENLKYRIQERTLLFMNEKPSTVLK